MRTALGIALNSPVAMLVIWGPDRLMLYNDAYAACAGNKHPAALGARLDSMALWPEVRERQLPLLQACFAGEAQSSSDEYVPLQQNGGQRHAWFDFSYAPLWLDDVVQGVLCTMTDMTMLPRAGRRIPDTLQQLKRLNRDLIAERDEAVHAHRSLAKETDFLRDLLAQAPSFMAVLKGPDHIFELVNHSFTQLFGAHAVVGRPAREAMTQVLDQQVFELLDEVYRSGKTYSGREKKFYVRNGQGQHDHYQEYVLDFVLQPIRSAAGLIEGIFIEGVDITNRFAAEERLRIADSAGGIGIFEWFPATGEMVISDRFREIWGLREDELVDDKLLVSLIEEEHQQLVGPARIGAKSNPLEYVEYAIHRRSDGQRRWVARKGEVVQDHPHAPRRYVGVVFDVTERKAIEQALHTSEASVRANNAFVRQLLDSTDQGFYAIDQQGVTTLCNAAFLRLLGFSGEDQVLGRSLHHVIHHSHPDGSVYDIDDSPILRAAREGRSVQVDSEFFFRADGSSFPVSYQVHPVWTDGKLDGALCTFVDLTERKRGMQALLWSENRLTAIFNQASVCFSELDLQGRYLRVNDALCSMLGRSQEHLLQMSLMDVTHPDDVAINMSMFNRCIEDGKSFALEKRYIRTDGSSLWVSSNISRIVDEEGRPQAMIAVSTDISERRRAEEALRDLNDTLEQRVVEEILERSRAEAALRQMQKMEAVGQLTGGVAHDFNNVLQIIGGNLQLVQSDPAIPDKSRQRVAVAANAVDRGAKLSAQLLAFARRQPLQPRSINLQRILQNMDELLRRALGETIEIATVVSPGLWNSMLDPNQVENLIINMAINARDAMPNGGRITLELNNAELSDPHFLSQADLPAGDYVQLAISDNGHGMSADVRERAFEPFFTTKGEGEGTGLGLSMAYGFVKQSRGHIHIHSEPQQGTTIRIYFPRSLTQEVELEDDRDMEVRGGDETILVVEDDPNLQLTVIDSLTSLGYTVLKADNGERALEIVRSGAHIDMLFTDVVMPGSVPATELARMTRQLLPSAEVLFTSGYPRDAIVHEGRLDPGVELLSKPYRLDQLARRVHHMLANRQHAKQLSQIKTGTLEQVRIAANGQLDPVRIVPLDNMDSVEKVERMETLQAGGLSISQALEVDAPQEEQLVQEAQSNHTPPQDRIGEPHSSGGEAHEEAPEAGNDVPSPGLRILVVEDNLDSQQLVCELLETLGHFACGVSSAEDALLQLAQQSFGVLFTDVNLPGMSGVDLAKQALASYPALEVIFASGYGAVITKNVGFSAHSLPKPYDIDQLQDLLAKIAARGA
ncbi:hybrid sensor histidine kinase/response regulator [Herbaspirillum lusitanum]